MGIRSDKAVVEKRDELYRKLQGDTTPAENAELRTQIEVLEWVIGNTHEL